MGETASIPVDLYIDTAVTAASFFTDHESCHITQPHHTGQTMAVSRLYSWFVLALLLACCSAKTLKDLKVKRRRRTEAVTSSYYGGGYDNTYGADGSSYASGGNAINNLFGGSNGDKTKSYSYAYSSYSYGGGDFSSCQADPNDDSTTGFLCSDLQTCISGAKSCDSNPDCPDHSDELG